LGATTIDKRLMIKKKQIEENIQINMHGQYIPEPIATGDSNQSKWNLSKQINPNTQTN
jgi:hypothetical protein